ncbi:MAG: dephospho-CoA kinase [Planctomycetota bacterium]
MSDGQLIVLGLYGGVGCGKSTVASFFQQLGATVIDADRLAHACLEQARVRDSIVAEFGPEMVTPAGDVDREELARVVFADEKQRQRLNGIIHPEVRRLIHARLNALESQGIRQLVVLDVPLLLEGGLYTLCDKHLFVEAPLEVRQERVRRVRGWNAGELERREKTQESIDAKRDLADYKITNDGQVEPVRARVRALFHEILSQP